MRKLFFTTTILTLLTIASSAQAAQVLHLTVAPRGMVLMTTHMAKGQVYDVSAPTAASAGRDAGGVVLGVAANNRYYGNRVNAYSVELRAPYTGDYTIYVRSYVGYPVKVLVTSIRCDVGPSDTLAGRWASSGRAAARKSWPLHFIDVQKYLTVAP